MKSWFRPLLLLPPLVLAFASPLLPGADVPPAPAAAESPAGNAEKASPAVPAPTAAAPSTPAPAPAAEPALRRLDEPDDSPAAAIRSLADETRRRAEETRRRADENRQRLRARADEDRARARARQANRTGNDVVNVFSDSTLEAGERADNVVAVFGSATSAGDVTESVVAVFGHSRVSGPVGERVVTVFGTSDVTARVDEEIVSVFGDVSINSRVKRVVTIFGNVKLGPEAEVDEEVVCVMGRVIREPGSIVHHQVRNFGRSFGLGSGFGTWISECVLKARLLAFHVGVTWAWIVAFSFLAFYLLLAVLFRGGMEKCLTTLETRPGAVAFSALGAVMLKPVVYVVLCITVIGALAVPFLATGLFIAELFGVAVVLAWIGRQFSRLIGPNRAPLALGVLVGGLLVLVLYTVPVLGFLTYLIIGWLGLGSVLCTLFAGRKRREPVVAPMAMAAAGGGVGASVGVAMGATAIPSPVFPVMTTEGGVRSEPRPSSLPPPVISAVTMPRAGFWIRFGSMLLDLFLLAVLAAFMTGHSNLAPFGVLAYATLMWKLKGTTIGGVICNLKVVRLDGREIDWSTAIVRSLGCFLSLAVFGLGFIWVAIDDDAQSWHDKIAGTTVVRVPKGTSLL